MKDRIFVIGASLSEIDALCRLVKLLPAGFPAPIFGTQHVASHSPGMFPSILQEAGRHMKIDHVCRLQDMARILVELAKDPPVPVKDALDRLMEIENRIAEGIFNVDDWWQLEQLSQASGLNCPSCSSALYELNDSRVL